MFVNETLSTSLGGVNGLNIILPCTSAMLILHCIKYHNGLHYTLHIKSDLDGSWITPCCKSVRNHTLGS